MRLTFNSLICIGVNFICEIGVKFNFFFFYLVIEMVHIIYLKVCLSQMNLQSYFFHKLNSINMWHFSWALLSVLWSICLAPCYCVIYINLKYVLIFDKAILSLPYIFFLKVFGLSSWRFQFPYNFWTRLWIWSRVC